VTVTAFPPTVQTTQPAPVCGALPRLTAFGHEVDTSPAAFGQLRRSSDIAHDVGALRERMREDGYLYIPGYLNSQAVLDARREVTALLAAEGLLDPHHDPMEAIAAPNPPAGVRAGNPLARRSPALQRLLFSGRMIEFYRRFLGGDILYFKYVWLRTRRRGPAAAPHYDIVFMGRGTPNVCTAWTPLGDIPYELGGLMMLENSHRLERVKNTYGKRDVDAYCENKPQAEEYANGRRRFSGHISRNPVRLRERLGGRWLTAEFRPGDLLTFSMYTLHASLDNQTDQVRLSTDTRYQLASEPADERWSGEEPMGHGDAARRGLIC
jgi:hypothetical protein